MSMNSFNPWRITYFPGGRPVLIVEAPAGGFSKCPGIFIALPFFAKPTQTEDLRAHFVPIFV
jgi:hypothetical protein